MGDLSASRARGQPCDRGRAPLKPHHLQSDNGPAPMLAIGIIAIFLGVNLALNKIEFGRFD
ncbi:hypothetical protein [Caulobacter sp. AP07]|uniref:hypothetical protein n=1 Tax=Caulobacter sp. AP07 TaxID=1144304 RepID=UPI0002E4CCBA|nr:hypothetical protein [Caulobacter sp. AP07]